MKLRILGSGTSTGVPEIGCKCEVCTSADPRDNRLRASSLLHTDDAVILIDCGPDFREQMLRAASFEKIDGVLITHEHYDHVGGLDDLRPFCRFGEIPIYSDEYTATHLRARMPYCFLEHKYPGVPQIFLQEVEAGKTFFINNTEITPLQVMHGRLPILGYRIGKRMAYITDIGMTGPINSVIGMDKKASIKRFVTTLPEKYKIAEGECKFNSCLFEINDETGRTDSIRRINL